MPTQSPHPALPTSGREILVKPLTAEQEKRRRQRSIAIALAVGALVAIFYAITIVRLGPNVFLRPY